MREAGNLTMSAKELERLEIIGRVVERRMTQRNAAERLDLSLRQVERLCRAFRTDGAAGLVSRQRGHPSNRKLAGALRERALDLVRGRYADFGPTLACEKLAEQHGVDISRETLRHWMTDAGLWIAAPTNLDTGGRVWASWSRSTVVSTPGSRTAARDARCSFMWTTRRVS